MKTLKTMAAVSVLAIWAGCAGPVLSDESTWIDPGQAVLRAAAEPQAGVTGAFALTVRSAGRTSKVHLNSESDYRDPRNLSIAVMPTAAAGLERMLGAPLEQSLKGKRILVSGTAMRVRIDFTVDGQATGKYYYQTHVLVVDASQIRIL